MQERSFDAAQPPEPVAVRRKHGRGRIAFVVAAFIVVVAIAASAGHHNSANQNSGSASNQAAQTNNKAPAAPAAPAKKVAPKPAPPQTVTYTITGSAPEGIDITWGTDSSNHAAHSLPFTETVPLDNSGGVLYYDVTAQLQGSGDISCQISVNGKVLKTGSASGGYNICMTEVTKDPFTDTWQGA